MESEVYRLIPDAPILFNDEETDRIGTPALHKFFIEIENVLADVPMKTRVIMIQ